MVVQDLIHQLQVGDLSELAAGNTSLIDTYLPTYLSAIQTGLTGLHTRFLLKQKFLIIQPIEGMTQYSLDYAHAFTNPNATIKYILDTEYDPFTWRNLQILEVHDEKGRPIPLNAPGTLYGVFSSVASDLMIPMNITARQIFLSCKADHSPLTDLASEIIIPVGLEKALEYFVASKIWGARKDADAIQKSVQYAQQYNDLINTAVDQGTAVTMDTVVFGAHDLGWR